MSALPRLVALLLATATGPLALAQELVPGEPRELGAIQTKEVHESSGLAASRAVDGALWTHNDHGDAARLFRIDRDGALLAEFPVDAEAEDWEDMASFERDGHSWLLVADTGDNDSERATVALHLIAEPAADATPTRAPLRPTRTLAVTYPGGPIDCEGLGVDARSGQVLLVSKVRKGSAKPTVFAIPLTALFGDAPRAPIEARRLASIDVPQRTTALDVSPDGRTLVVLTYGDAYAWVRGADEPWERALARPPQRLKMPVREQGETVCFTTDGNSLLLTTEGARSPIWSVPVQRKD